MKYAEDPSFRQIGGNDRLNEVLVMDMSEKQYRQHTFEVS